ncbi:MAG: hypothetical protein EXR60_02330 [Dehalococcoidia bacterium]|nr:hypothetical protein [Dehalococcoidia bacterium]
MPELKHAVNLWWEDVREGQQVPAYVRVTDLMNWNRYAAVNDEFIPFHMDNDAALAAKQPGVFGMGNLRWAYIHNMLHDWVGESGDVVAVDLRYTGLNFKNDTLTARGKVTRKYVEKGEHLVDLEVGVDNQKGENTAPGQATVRLPARGG